MTHPWCARGPGDRRLRPARDLTLKVPGRVLTGDWLFIGGAGRTDLPGGDPGEHWASLTRVIPSLDETTVVLPGHD
jgi:glyoxylase-like metal-dependent hydrolase (beta-lactamase superfamily II)